MTETTLRFRLTTGLTDGAHSPGLSTCTSYVYIGIYIYIFCIDNYHGVIHINSVTKLSLAEIPDMLCSGEKTIYHKQTRWTCITHICDLRMTDLCHRRTEDTI